MLTVSTLQVDSLKKGFDGFDKEGGTINQTTMMMILKSMGVDVNKVSRPSSTLHQTCKQCFTILTALQDCQSPIKDITSQTDMDNYAADVDEEAAGKFNFTMFCQVRTDGLQLKSGQYALPKTTFFFK